jgi:peptidylprolyl isomerase
MRKLLLVLALAFPLFAAPEKPAAPADLQTPPADAEKLENGLAMKKLAEGKGTAKLQGDDLARLRYTVWKSDGTLVQHVPVGSSLLIAQNKMLPGWATAVQAMVPGETRRVWIPASLGAGKIKEGEHLVIDTELIDIVPYPKTPEDVAAPPADAKKTESGLAYKVLRPGTGDKRPKRSSTVLVHYSGWTTDGKMFDSSVVRGQSVDFTLDAVIKGWTEGLQLMVEGERTRFWIPANLAYGNEKGKPQGTLVFDIELMAIK